MSRCLHHNCDFFSFSAQRFCLHKTTHIQLFSCEDDAEDVKAGAAGGGSCSRDGAAYGGQREARGETRMAPSGLAASHEMWSECGCT